MNPMEVEKSIYNIGNRQRPIGTALWISYSSPSAHSTDDMKKTEFRVMSKALHKALQNQNLNCTPISEVHGKIMCSMSKGTSVDTVEGKTRGTKCAILENQSMKTTK